MLYGAILGDIIGSRFEFDRGPWTKDFELFTDESHFTDDTVMTVAVANALLRFGEDSEILKRALPIIMFYWADKYPNAGYGAMFRYWLNQDDPKPYYSFGNGSAMRVSPVGWMYPTLNKTMEMARVTAEVSHNHPEGIKGAECTASVIFLARKGYEKRRIKDFVESEFGYDLSKSVEQLQSEHKHDESCMDSMPKALIAFFEGKDFEDVIRNAVSMGGDADTIAAIAGSMAEAFYGIPNNLVDECKARVPEDIMNIIQSFQKEAFNMLGK